MTNSPKPSHSKSEMRRHAVMKEAKASPREWWITPEGITIRNKPFEDAVHVVEMSYYEQYIKNLKDELVRTYDQRNKSESALTRANKKNEKFDREKNALQGAYSSMMFQRDELEAELATLRAQEIAHLQLIDGLGESVESLLAERDRYKAALEKIMNANGSPHDEDFITTTAREALK